MYLKTRDRRVQLFLDPDPVNYTFSDPDPDPDFLFFQKCIDFFKIFLKFEAERRSEDAECFYSITYLKTSTSCIFLREF
jgi:hypothetical protein